MMSLMSIQESRLFFKFETELNLSGCKNITKIQVSLIELRGKEMAVNNFPYYFEILHASFVVKNRDCNRKITFRDLSTFTLIIKTHLCGKIVNYVMSL